MIAYSAVYQHRNPDGSVTYSDQPSSGSEKVKLPPETIFHEPTPPTTPADQPSKTPNALKESPKSDYKVFAISDPADGLTFHNQRKIRISLLIDPPLQGQDTVQLLLDDKDYGAPTTNTQIYLDNVARGEHTVQAKLIDDKGRVIKTTNKITIYIHYAHLGG